MDILVHPGTQMGVSAPAQDTAPSLGSAVDEQAASAGGDLSLKILKQQLKQLDASLRAQRRTKPQDAPTRAVQPRGPKRSRTDQLSKSQADDSSEKMEKSTIKHDPSPMHRTGSNGRTDTPPASPRAAEPGKLLDAVPNLPEPSADASVPEKEGGLEAEVLSDSHNSPPNNFDSGQEKVKPQLPPQLATPGLEFARETLRLLSSAPPTPLTQKQRQGLVKTALIVLGNDAKTAVIAVTDMANGFLAAHPSEYTAAVVDLVKGGLFFQIATAPQVMDIAEKCVAICRPALMHEFDIRSLSEMMELDSGLAAFAEYVRLTCAGKVASAQRQVIQGEAGVRIARISASGLHHLKVFQLTLQSLDGRRRRMLKSVHVRAAGTVNVLVAQAAEHLGREAEGG